MRESQENSIAWQKGFKAGLIGLAPKNPYPKGTEAALRYAGGFVEGRGVRGKQVTHGSVSTKVPTV